MKNLIKSLSGGILLGAFTLISSANAQLVIDDMPRGVYYERTARITNFWEMKNFRDVFHYDKLLLGRNIISGNISYNVNRIQTTDSLDRIQKQYRHALGFFTRIRFFEEFSLNTTFYKDLAKTEELPWIADFSYGFGRSTWRPNKFNYGYENYVNNKYTDSPKELGEKFLQGYYFLSYSNFLPKNILEFIKIDSTTNMRLTYFTRYSIKYKNEFEQIEGDILNGKPTGGINVRYVILRNIFIESAVLFYLNNRRQPWDPDYTYGFGYFDYRSFRMSLTYGNWAINRFNTKKKAYPYYGFMDGQFKVALNYIW